MRKIVAAIFTLISLSAVAQTAEKDSLLLSIPTDSLAIKDSVKTELISLPSDLDFAPADDSPELVADRLNCLERTIALPYNSKVHGFIEYFTVRDREYTRSMLRKKDLYFPLFEKKLKEYGLPDELKYLSIIESALNPRAYSAAHAVGLWQFMSGTSRYLGLHNDWSIDERMDPELATDAACRYLSQLHSIFNDWHLALAAYNSGPGTVRWAIRRSGYKKTFWEVYPFLPRETRSYVPQFIAMIYAINYAESHNLHELAREEFMPHDTIVVNKFFHFESFSKLTGSCTDDLLLLNPTIRKNAVPEDGQARVIKIPKGFKESFSPKRKEILDSVATAKKDWEVLAKKMSDNTYGRDRNIYYVKYGDALGTIAQRFGVSIKSLKQWNNLRSNMIRTGQRLIIWLAPSSKASVNIPVPTPSIIISTEAKTYTVQPGDTLWDISKKLPGITIEKLKELNKLKGSKLQPGQKLIVG
ncbi:MAG: LysM peptidoglycan-binding domain-containing protein [Cyclobacteriaceae bacterium]